ncbi:hypothetical protein ACHAW5_009253 [Stephanodiscus triporus]|uniref:Uncharacterized protein n=1 Tax=Stephanodiscus triporus TaxID=2934178 RepID=A0ABD3NM17_9STRA
MTTTGGRLALFLLPMFFATIAGPSSAWTPPPPAPSAAAAAAAVLRRRRDGVGPDDCARRDVLGVLSSFSSSSLVVAATVVGSSTPSSPANAASTTTTSSSSSSPQDARDKENIVRGYERLQYLLDNWDAETTVCKIGQETTFGDKCERNPTKVMEYLGYKSTSDPLFKAESAMMRLKSYVPADRETEYYDAIDLYSRNAEEANSMAFVSSWGEANPGGGKDRVRLFIERSRNNVAASRDGLRAVMDILDLGP